MLYPSDNEGKSYGDYYDFTKVKTHDSKCAIETISILDDNNLLDKTLGNRLAKIVLA